MLLAVEGGGFFSSSASGYSKGLTLLVLGRGSEDRPMRVSPWNQYRLVNQDCDTEFQLASWKNRVSSGCASFVCFGRTSAGLDGQSALKIGPTQPQGTLPGDPAICKEKEAVRSGDNENDLKNVSLKSSLKKRSHRFPVSVKNESEQKPLEEQDNDSLGFTEQRKVQWTDACGNELAEIREFELSETGDSDDEFENGGRKTCSCRIIRRMRVRLMELRRHLLDAWTAQEGDSTPASLLRMRPGQFVARFNLMPRRNRERRQRKTQRYMARSRNRTLAWRLFN